MHLLKNGQEVLDLYLSNLNKNLGEVDALACKIVSGDQLEVFNNFSAQKLPNVENNNIYQEQLTNYYNEKRREYRKDLNKLKSSYHAKTTAELTKLQNNLVELQKKENALTATNSDDIISAGRRNSGALSPPKTSFPRASAANSMTYSTPWFNVGWMNIDCYLKELNSKSDVEVIVSLEEDNANSVVYQCLDLINSIIPLNMNDTKGKAIFPARSSASSKRMESTFCLAISKEADELYYAEKRYNPYSTKQVDLNWEKINKGELYARLRAISPLNNKLIAEMKKEERLIEEQLEIRRKQEENQRKIEEIQAQQAKENAFIQNLIDEIDRCKEVDKLVSTIATASFYYSCNLPNIMFQSDPDYWLGINCTSNIGDSIENFNLIVVNSKKEVIYTTTDPYFQWNGKDETGKFVQEGKKYSYSFKGTFKSGSFFKGEQGLIIISESGRQ